MLRENTLHLILCMYLRPRMNHLQQDSENRSLIPGLELGKEEKVV